MYHTQSRHLKTGVGKCNRTVPCPADMNKSSLGVIKKKKSNLKRLTGVLKDLLVKESSPKSEEDQDYKTPPKTRKDGVVYILSKENRLIPKLSDEEIMERHRKADENMKRVWSEIIAKYENIEDQGDTIDLRTGEIIQDNGHLRNLNQNDRSSKISPDTAVVYKSVLRDILDIDDDQALNTSIWNEEEDTNQDSKLIKEAEVEEEEFLEEPDSDNDYTSESYHNIARER